MRIMKNKIPPPVYMLLCGALMWFVAHTPYALIVDVPFERFLAAIVAMAAIAIDVTAIWHFRQSRTTINPLNPQKSSSLVTHGIYRYTRNPMYVGMLLLLIAWALLLESVTSLLGPAAFVVTLTTMQIRPEEEAMKSLFPDEYQDYCRRVRRWM